MLLAICAFHPQICLESAHNTLYLKIPKPRPAPLAFRSCLEISAINGKSVRGHTRRHAAVPQAFTHHNIWYGFAARGVARKDGGIIAVAGTTEVDERLERVAALMLQQ